MTITITATFKNRMDAELALNDLESSGISRENMSLLVADQYRKTHFEVSEASKAPEGVATGGVVGGVAGGLAAALAAVAAISVPGVGILATGPIIAALTGGGAGALAGGLVGGLIGLGVPEHEAKLTEGEIKKGAILIGVTVPNHEDKKVVKAILERHHAKHLAAA